MQLLLYIAYDLIPHGQIIQRNIGKKLPEFHYYRFVTHLKFFAQRLVNEKLYEQDENDELLDTIRKKYVNSYKCVEKIAAFVKNRYSYMLSNDEPKHHVFNFYTALITLNCSINMIHQTQVQECTLLRTCL